MYQVDWVTGCPDIWSNNVLDRSVWGFSMRLTFKLLKRSKMTALPGMGGLFQASESLRGAQAEQERIRFSCPRVLSWDINFLLPLHSKRNLHHWLSWVSGLQTSHHPRGNMSPDSVSHWPWKETGMRRLSNKECNLLLTKCAPTFI